MNKDKWLTEDIANTYQLIIQDLNLDNSEDIDIRRKIRSALQEQYGITEIEAINVLNGHNVSDYILKYHKLKSAMVLKAIRSSDLLCPNSYQKSKAGTQFVLSHASQITCSLSTQFRTKECGILDIDFINLDMFASTMEVIQHKNNQEKEYIYEYSTDIFKKYICAFTRKQINCIDAGAKFNGEEIVLEFYNEVIRIGNKIEE